jgi:hypothetical protein
MEDIKEKWSDILYLERNVKDFYVQSSGANETNIGRRYRRNLSMDLHQSLDVSIVDQKVVISVMASGGEGRRSTIGPTIPDINVLLTEPVHPDTSWVGHKHPSDRH